DMYNGTIRYACSDYNSVLSQWLSRKGMPPTYTLSGKVYVLRLKDGTHAALKLTDYRNEMYVNGYMRVQYIYPLENALK
ncbi:HmuY family protein, partial [Phocaeicola coprophilus]